MKLTVEFEGNEKMTNIGLAKAIIDTEHFEAADLCEIGRYLIIYSESRTNEKLLHPCAFRTMKGGAE